MMNKVIIYSFNGCDGNIASINSIIFDEFGKTGTICANSLLVYDNKEVLINKSSPILQYSLYAGFDSKKRFVIVFSKSINIYSNVSRVFSFNNTTTSVATKANPTTTIAPLLNGKNIFILKYCHLLYQQFFILITIGILNAFNSLFTHKISVKPIDGIKFQYFSSFTFNTVSNKTIYYVASYDKICMFNDNWDFIGYRNFSYVYIILAVKDNIYISRSSGIVKTDRNLNSIDFFNNFDTFGSMYFSSTNNLLYIARYQSILILDLNLKLKGTIYYSDIDTIFEYKNKIYASQNNKVFALVNNSLVKSFELDHYCGPVKLSDQFGYMLSTCYFQGDYLYLLYPNGTNSMRSLKFKESIRYVGFDSKGNLICLTDFEIVLFSNKKFSVGTTTMGIPAFQTTLFNIFTEDYHYQWG